MPEWEELPPLDQELLKRAWDHQRTLAEEEAVDRRENTIASYIVFSFIIFSWVLFDFW